VVPRILPTVRIGKADITRLILGGNPVSGVSHQSPQRDREMVEYFTTERIKAHLRQAEGQGINTFLARGDRHIRRLLAEYRAEGGRIQWIGQLAGEVEDWRMNLRQIAEAGAVAIYLHGSSLDHKFFKPGHPDGVLPYLAFIRDELGLPAGLCSHSIRWLSYAEERGWPVDWYMVSMYDLARQERHSPIVGGRFYEERFDHADRAAAFEFARSVDRPCVMFKVLACGRLARTPREARETLAEAFRRIKPADAVCVGMWNKLRDEVAAGAAVVREICGG
jgi:hypothetical protein